MKNTKYTVIIDGKLTKWFDVLLRVRQECLILPTLFKLFLEFVMLYLTSVFTEFQIDDTSSVIDIKYADDKTLLSTAFERLKMSTEELQLVCSK